MDDIFDLAIIGGGINGCGIARDAAGRGMKVYLCEQDDLASGTSSWSTKLIHGGLRYLEHYKFRLVREALIEREILWALAPHIVEPLRFVLPHHSGLRPAWLLRLGLFLYDHLGGRRLLAATTTLDLRKDTAGAPLRAGFTTAFEYSDCRVQDSRLVVLNAMDARLRGAEIETRSRLEAAARADGIWTLRISGPDGAPRTVRARALVNAAGPWVADVLADRIHIPSAAKVRLVKGSHVVVSRIFGHDRAYIFQNADGRIIFAIPYEQDFTLIGTTDLDYAGDPAKVAASPEEIDYLCAAASEYFATPIAAESVVWTFSGVRPLYDDGASKAQEATRDYVLTLDAPATGAPLLSVFGGKITTYRRLAEAALAKLVPHMEPHTKQPAGMPGEPAGWTARAPLPGGAFPVEGLAALIRDLADRYSFLEPGVAARLARTHGTLTTAILGNAKSSGDLGRDFGGGLSEREVRHFMAEEWAVTAEDILWRRTKLGLHLTITQTEALRAFVENIRLH